MPRRKTGEIGGPGWHTGGHVHFDAPHRPVRGEQDGPEPGQGHSRRGAVAPEAPVDPCAGSGGAGGHEAQGPPPRAAPRHRVRGGVVPEPRRVLLARHRDVHGDGRALHPPLPVLRRGPRAPRSPRPRGAAPARGHGRAPRAPARRHHLGGPGRPPRRRGRALRVVRARGPGADAVHPYRDPRPRLPGADGARPRGARPPPRPTSSTTTSRPCPGSTARCARGRTTPGR